MRRIASQEGKVEILGDFADLRVRCLLQVEACLSQPCRQCPHRANALRSPLRQGASMGCGMGCSAGYVSVQRHVLVKRETRPHSCREVLTTPKCNSFGGPAQLKEVPCCIPSRASRSPLGMRVLTVGFCAPSTPCSL